MNKRKSGLSYLMGRMSNIRIGQRLVIGMMLIITILVMPIILLLAESFSFQTRYNRTLENLSDISYIIQETEKQGYRIIDYCTMDMNIGESGETEIIVQMLYRVSRIRENIGNDERYQANLDTLQIVENLILNYAESYKRGAGKCGGNSASFSMAGDMDFYSMVDTANYIVKNCNKLQSLEMNRSEDLKNEISANFRRVLITVSVTVVVVILLVIVGVYAITGSIIYPLGVLMSHIADISKSGILDEDSGAMYREEEEAVMKSGSQEGAS